MWFIFYYLFAFGVILLHFAGVLKRLKAEWLIYVLAITVVPAIVYL